MLPFDRYFITSKVKTFRFVIISVYFNLINQVTRWIFVAKRTFRFAMTVEIFNMQLIIFIMN